MTDSVILVETESGCAYKVVEALKEKEASIVREAFVVTGPYDVVVWVSTEQVIQIGKFIIEELQILDGVVKTLTMIRVDA